MKIFLKKIVFQCMLSLQFIFYPCPFNTGHVGKSRSLFSQKYISNDLNETI